MKKIFLSTFLILSVFFSMSVSEHLIGERNRQVFIPVRDCGPTLIIDPGHGGEDGGAVSLSGAKESLINLAIARRLDQIMGLCGVPVVILRTEDISLHDSSAATIREKKVSDLHNRAKIINDIEKAVLVSIHQNSFQDPRYRGAHVFYAPTEKSREFAECVQGILRNHLDPQNERVTAPISDTVYLMNHIGCPGILVECGFLSNAEEDFLLQTPEYQLMVATALSGAYLQYQETTKDDV